MPTELQTSIRVADQSRRVKRRPWLGLMVLPPLAVLAACGSNGATTESGHRIVVPNIVGLSQGAATSSLGHAGLTLGVIAGIPSSRSPAGTVIATNPSEGESVTPGATVSLTVSAGDSASPGHRLPPRTSQPARGGASGNVASVQSTDTGSICVKVGSVLRVTFVSGGGWSGYGRWSASPPTISDDSVLEGRSYGSSGKRARAVFRAVGPGSATVTAQFDVSCAPADTTPCTVPPGSVPSSHGHR